MKTRILFTSLSLLVVIVISNTDLVLGLTVAIPLLALQEALTRENKAILAGEWLKIRNKRADLNEWEKQLEDWQNELERDKRIAEFWRDCE